MKTKQTQQGITCKCVMTQDISLDGLDPINVLCADCQRLLRAAPELLSACKMALASMEEALLRDDPEAAMNMEWETDPMVSLRAAIKRAENG